MKVITAEKDGDLVVCITGDVDHHSAVGLREEIDRLLEEKKPKNLLLDLGGTDFMDSSGLGLILGRKRKTEEMGIGLTLINPTELCRRILRLAGMENQINMKFM